MKPRLSAIIVLCLFCGCCSKASAQEAARACDDYDVFLLIGQSNMAGRAYMTEGDDEVIDGKVFLLDDDGQVVPARNPLNRYSSIRKDLSMQGICPGLGFSKKLAAKTGRKILLVVNARGGTTMAQWAKGEEGEGYYEEAVRRARQAMRYGTLKAILWHQGCGDVYRTDVYMERLSAFVSELRSDLGTDAPFIAGELGRWRGHVAAFNGMLHTISDHIPGSGWVSSEGCLPIATKASNGEPDLRNAHFDRNSQIILGERYADAVLGICYDEK